MSDPLVTYLEDHKAGAGLAIGLLQAMEARHWPARFFVPSEELV